MLDVARQLRGQVILQLRAQHTLQRDVGNVRQPDHSARSHRHRIADRRVAANGEEDAVAHIEVAVAQPRANGRRLHLPLLPSCCVRRVRRLRLGTDRELLQLRSRGLGVRLIARYRGHHHGGSRRGVMAGADPHG